MAHGVSKKVIYAALIGNGLIAVTKFVAAAVTGSSAMLSEGIHSLVDTGNQVLMLHGVRRAELPADSMHPFGYGRELYFWAFVVAMLLFAIGAGVSLYEGVLKTLNPHPVKSVYVNYIVLGLAAIFEAGAWWVAFKEFKRRKGSRTVWRAIRDSKDPALITVLFEDSAAMLGLIVAFIGIGLYDITGNPIFDGLASIAIGIILALTAMLLSYETKGLLIGESGGQILQEGVDTVLQGQRGILAINESLTMHMGPDDVLLNLSLDFSDDLTSAEVEAIVSDLERRIKLAHPEIKRIFIEAQSRAAHNAGQAGTV